MTSDVAAFEDGTLSGLILSVTFTIAAISLI